MLDTGQLAITVDGVDMLQGKDLAIPNDRLLPESTFIREAQQRAHELENEGQRQIEQPAAAR